MPSSPETDVDQLITYGQMAFEQGWYDQARDYFEQTLELDASNEEAMNGLAQVNEILSRRAVAERLTPEAPSAKPAGKERSIAGWVRQKGSECAGWLRKKRRAYEEWVERRRRERERRAAERQAARELRRWAREEEVRRRYWKTLEQEVEEYREWWETGVAPWEERHRHSLAEEIAGEMLAYELMDDDDLFDDLF